MALKPCRECKKEVSDSAQQCPHCGVSSPAAPPAARAVAGIFAMLGFVAIVWFFFFGGLQGSVAGDFEEQYDVAKRGGDSMQMCVHAGIVSAAYLQAKDETNYRRWQAIEISDCRAAGLPR